MQTIGISPKVLVPTVAQILAGVAFILLGHDVEGKTLIVTALGTLGLGYQAPVGTVDVNVGTPSDDLLSPPPA